jgi:hypothetical protein
MKKKKKQQHHKQAARRESSSQIFLFLTRSDIELVFRAEALLNLARGELESDRRGNERSRLINRCPTNSSFLPSFLPSFLIQSS